MTYNITFKNSVFRDLKKINKTDTDLILNKIEKDLSDNPLKYPVLTGKFSGLRKYKIGDYRIIYTVLTDTVLILRISHRKDVYKR